MPSSTLTREAARLCAGPGFALPSPAPTPAPGDGLALDRITGLTAASGRALVNVPSTLPLFDTHFQRSPIVPGVLYLQLLADLAALVVAQGDPDAVESSTLREVQRAKFRRMGRPGDQLTVSVEALAPHRPLGDATDDGGAAFRGSVAVPEGILMDVRRFVVVPGPSPREVLA
ncbi:hypothetical protein [Sinomonas mesophila]|uniref:hypothetical protein n=1 Tax=Sinomonas mesophila TaxID=1531955 RepID=UPI0009842ECB|nr:hypothetical protein [Sinomonas mesophila]